MPQGHPPEGNPKVTPKDFTFYIKHRMHRAGIWPRGPMDKASAYGAGDCGFESHLEYFLSLARGLVPWRDYN